MKKLVKIVRDIVDHGKLPKGITPYMAQEILFIYEALCNGKSYPFISPEIFNLLQKCCIKIEKDDNGLDIGWIAIP